MKIRAVYLFMVLIIAGGLSWHGTMAQSSQEQYFEQTGHWVSGEFLEAYNRVSTPLLLYGYPITDAYRDPTTGTLVQYFQKARFEQQPGAPAGLNVHLTPLGQYLYVPGQAFPVAGNSPACRLFPETGKPVCYGFLAFFEENGGVAQFGYPISNLEIHNQLRVQYFQLARFEWHPEFPAGQRVMLSNLGSQYFSMRGEDPALQLPNRNGDIINGVLALKARAFPLRAVTGSSGSQTVYIIVQDQRLLPVANARVTLLVRMPSGEVSQFIVPELTNERGITQYTFPFSARSVGVAEIRVTVTHEKVEGRTVTSFRIWF